LSIFSRFYGTAEADALTKTKFKGARDGPRPLRSSKSKAKKRDHRWLGPIVELLAKKAAAQERVTTVDKRGASGR
jgi:hypothetical protein